MITPITAKTAEIQNVKVRTSPASAIKHYLLPFMVFFAVALVSGLFYYLVPRSWNWLASQTALWIHLLTGVISFFYLVPYVLSHHKEKKEAFINLIFVWRAFRRRENENDWSYQQRIFGHILNWVMSLLGLSGLILLIPSILWMSGMVFMAGYPAYKIANAAHLGLALISLAFIGFHVIRRPKRAKKNINR
ncbi:MAG: hypothetical protein DYG85_04785 [Chloroflexi bacterium CFX1]|nr:hypothetical protein [Chloroflexi bacterium CFX1]MCQ3953301.1 hypothetical protein [Chloroflexota bacterium]MDL1918643.1 hypothetical protein [Chloroflexi bacterium CFX5]NUQ58864.1 hypothetical protein [Anaerolineales bacterium]